MPERGRAIEAITFDFYGTLARHRTGRGRGATLLDYLRGVGLESDPWEHQVLYDVFEDGAVAHGSPLDDRGTREYLARFAERVFRRLAVRPARRPTPDEVEAIWQILGPSCLVTYPEVLAVLAQLRQAGYRMAVISNWHCGLARFCAELGIGAFFETVVVSAELGCAKPDGRIFEEACRRLAVPAARVLHVGDTREEDLEGARRAGLDALLVVREAPTLPADVPALTDLNGVLPWLGEVSR